MAGIDLEINRGDDEKLDIAFKNPAGGVLDVTGHQGIWFTAKHSSLDLDADAVIQKTVGTGIVVTNAPQGLATVSIDDTDTVDVEPTTLVWDAQIKDAAGEIRTAASGTLKIRADVTRAT